jgi:SAM-dependent methyltransferase
VDSLTIHNLVSTVQNVDDYKYNIDWLLQLRPSFDSIINFGCNIGYETIALAWILNSKEVIGLDKNADCIRQATDKVKTIREDIENVRRYLQYELGWDEEFRVAVQNLLQSFAGKVAPQFVEDDAILATKIPENHFDLVYCERFLYHFACEDKHELQKHTKNVIESMTRAARLGGFIVCIEPKVCSFEDNRIVNLVSAFEQNNLEKVDVSHISPQIDYEAVYVYQKRN